MTFEFIPLSQKYYGNKYIIIDEEEGIIRIKDKNGKIWNVKEIISFQGNKIIAKDLSNRMIIIELSEQI